VKLKSQEERGNEMVAITYECPNCHRHGNHAEGCLSYGLDFSPAVQQAFRDWNDNRAYLDNGRNYRVRPEPATPTYRPKGKVASWNREVKRLFADSGEFHRAATEFRTREIVKP
jgi:hypothetical protein